MFTVRCRSFFACTRGIIQLYGGHRSSSGCVSSLSVTAAAAGDGSRRRRITRARTFSTTTTTTTTFTSNENNNNNNNRQRGQESGIVVGPYSSIVSSASLLQWCFEKQEDTADDDSRLIKVLSEKLNLAPFQDPSLLIASVTHPSCIPIQQPVSGTNKRKSSSRNKRRLQSSSKSSYERLEFVGEKVLGLILAERLYYQFPSFQEDELHNHFETLVSSRMLAQISADLELNQHLRVADTGFASQVEKLHLHSPKEQHTPTDVYKAYSDIVEAIVAAVYVDQGLPAANELVQHLFTAKTIQRKLPFELHVPLPPPSKNEEGTLLPSESLLETVDSATDEENVDESLQQLRKVLGVTFHDPTLLRMAVTQNILTEREGVAGRVKSFERLEFVGDRLLGLVIAELLYHRFPSLSASKLDTHLNYLVSNEMLAAIADDVDLEEYFTAQQVNSKKHEAGHPTLFSDSMEAILAAVYLDQGLVIAKALIERLWEKYLSDDILQERVQPSNLIFHKVNQALRSKKLPRPPLYSLAKMEPEDERHHQNRHGALPAAARCKIVASVEGLGSVEAVGTSKDKAEKGAAEKLLQLLVLNSQSSSKPTSASSSASTTTSASSLDSLTTTNSAIV